MIGEFGSAPAYAAMIDATKRLLAWKLSLHGVDPLGWTELQNRASNAPLKFPYGALVAVPTVLGHRDLGLTSCPGTNVYDTIGAIRQALATPRSSREPAVRLRALAAVEHRHRRRGTIDTDGGIRVAGAADPTAVVGVRDARGHRRRRRPRLRPHH